MPILIKRLLLTTIAATISILLSLLVVFSSLEFFPVLLEKLPLDIIPYYAQKRKYQPDEELVFVPRKMHAHVDRCVFKGNLHLKKYRKQAPAIKYVASYGANGFRTNSSQAPYEVVLIGDSYLEIGESDDKTLSEQLKALSGFSTYNLGREWYGPYQYLKIFRRHAIKQRPRFVLFCFFSGNDIRDIQQYENWLNGGDYYGFVLSRSFLSRFHVVLAQVASGLVKTIDLCRGVIKDGVDRHEVIYSDLGFVKIGNQEIPMRFGYWNPTATAEELLAKHEWTTLRDILFEFKDISYQQKIVPVVVYIPHKMEVYGELITNQSGLEVRNRLTKQLVSMDNSVTAFRRIAAELNINLIDLTPAFRAVAIKGELIYYPFDTHWNPLGRQIAAQLITTRLREIEAGASD